MDWKLNTWSLNKKLPKEKGIKNIGTVIGFSESEVTIPGFSDFIYSSRSLTHCENAELFFCNQACNCSSPNAEDVLAAEPTFNLYVYTAVYAIAHALHNALQCGSGRCNRNITVYPHIVPTLPCSPECRTGYAKKYNGIHKCCFDCEMCPIGTYVNSTGYITCINCKETEWSAAGSTSCNLRVVEYIPFTDSGAILIMVGASALVGLTLAMSVLFAINYNTPVVRSAGGPMCFLILGCLSLCSLSIFFYFGKPTISFCILRFLPFILFYTVCLACFVVRSFQIVSSSLHISSVYSELMQ
uniref:Taste receptor type 1 member 1-like n=1 Tax=Sander lucioperca TaxID=283035 RepID=A0A8C9Y6R2_SANLU